MRVGKVSFEANKLRENAHRCLDSVMKAKPASSKGRYLKSVTVSSTMGPGIRLDAVALSKTGEYRRTREGMRKEEKAAAIAELHEKFSRARVAVLTETVRPDRQRSHGTPHDNFVAPKLS